MDQEIRQNLSIFDVDDPPRILLTRNPTDSYQSMFDQCQIYASNLTCWHYYLFDERLKIQANPSQPLLHCYTLVEIAWEGAFSMSKEAALELCPDGDLVNWLNKKLEMQFLGVSEPRYFTSDLASENNSVLVYDCMTGETELIEWIYETWEDDFRSTLPSCKNAVAQVIADMKSIVGESDDGFHRMFEAAMAQGNA